MQQFINTLVRRAYKVAENYQSEKINIFSQKFQGLNEDEIEYKYALEQNKSYFKQTIFGIPNEISLLKKCIQDQTSTEKILFYGEQAIWEFYCKKDYTNALKCGELTLSYMNKQMENDNISICNISLIMAESCLQNQQYAQALKYLYDAEESFHLNIEELEYESKMYYFYTLKISQLYLKLNMVDKCYIYAIMCLNSSKKLSHQKKVSPCLNILNYYICKKNNNEALEFGNAFLEQVSFKNIFEKYSPQEIESLCELYKIVINLLSETRRDQQKAFILIEQLELLLQIIKSQDENLIKSLEIKKEAITKSLSKQQDLLFVLSFYGQKQKLESSPVQITKSD